MAAPVLDSKVVSVESALVTRPEYQALIYIPQNEKNQSSFSSLMGVRNSQRSPFSRYFQICVNGVFTVFMLHPGTNLGYHQLKNDDTEIIQKISPDWIDQIKTNPLDKKLIDNQSLIILTPEQTTHTTPQYADFSESDALMLVENHTHERWIDAALITESRVIVKTAAENQKKLILSERKKLTEGQ